MNIKSLIFVITILSSVSFVFSQLRPKDTIDNQVVNVVKPYTPKISDAFKIKDIPSLNTATSVDKKPVKYNIFSIPVASTFTPAKGKVVNIDKAKAVKLFDNYASLGLGNYGTILGDVYLNHALSNTENVGGYISHHSSQGGIDNLLLDDAFSKTSLNAYYGQKLSNLSWKIDGGFSTETYNWYGLQQSVFGQAEADVIDPSHTFNSFDIGGKLNFKDAIINEGYVRFRRFTDDYNSGENRFVASTSFDIPVQDETFETAIFLDYISGNFDKDINTFNTINYGNFTLGLAPNYQIIQDDLTVDLGIKLVYLNDTELSDNSFFVYPNIEASYRLVDDIIIAFGGVKGDLIQNSYYDFASQNPFISPTLFVTPTDKQYKGFLGFKGKLSNAVSYSINGNYTSEKNKALFTPNIAITSDTENYNYGNSFNVVYDDVKTLSVAGELNIDVNRNFTLGIKGAYFNYTTEAQTKAWNLPDITGSIFLDLQITEQWFAGASAFYVGERKDQLQLTTLSTSLVTLDSYFDANMHLGYKFTDQLSFFAKANNIVGEAYEKWLNFPVQGFQILAGATYQFDF